ncbi:MAG: antibiotic biosynthesis monooxygenase [Clostridia bacterium]|nr:antibiotic biosynthesis monooxygenase [Clostridia bacterium]
MAITVNIYYRGKNGNAVKFAKEMISSGIVDKIRNESGNIRYDYFLPMDDSQTVLLIDCWQDQNALDIHHKSPLMAQIVALREKYDLHMEVERYVSDDTEISDLDKSFIRE